MGSDFDIKNYILSQYQIALSDFKCVYSQSEKNSAMRDMCRLQLLASEKVGFSFADELSSML